MPSRGDDGGLNGGGGELGVQTFCIFGVVPSVQWHISLLDLTVMR